MKCGTGKQEIKEEFIREDHNICIFKSVISVLKEKDKIKFPADHKCA